VDGALTECCTEVMSAVVMKVLASFRGRCHENTTYGPVLNTAMSIDGIVLLTFSPSKEGKLLFGLRFGEPFNKSSDLGM
jgi:hypothetical protein